MEETRKPPRKPRAKAAAPAAKPPVKSAARPAKPAAQARTVARKKTAPAVPSKDERETMVRLAAYFRAEQRGFVPGNEWEDWLAAEAEIDALAVAAKPPKAPARKTPKA
jgi:hypothetical protein